MSEMSQKANVTTSLCKKGTLMRAVGVKHESFANKIVISLTQQEEGDVWVECCVVESMFGSQKRVEARLRTRNLILLTDVVNIKDLSSTISMPSVEEIIAAYHVDMANRTDVTPLTIRSFSSFLDDKEITQRSEMTLAQMAENEEDQALFCKAKIYPLMLVTAAYLNAWKWLKQPNRAVIQTQTLDELPLMVAAVQVANDLTAGLNPSTKSTFPHMPSLMLLQSVQPNDNIPPCFIRVSFQDKNSIQTIIRIVSLANSMCPICYEPIDMCKVALLSCKHGICVTCKSAMKSTKVQCPMCRDTAFAILL